MNPLLFWHWRRNLLRIVSILMNFSHNLLHCIGEFMILIQDDLTVSFSVFDFLVRKREVLPVSRLDVFWSCRPGLIIRKCLRILQSRSGRAWLIAGLLLPVYGRRVGGTAGRWRWERIKSVPGRTPAQSHFRLRAGLLVIVNLLGELAEDVVDLIVDGDLAAPQLRPHSVLHLTPGPASVLVMATSSLMIGLRLSAGGEAIVKLSNDSVQEVQTAADIITETLPASVHYIIILYYIILQPDRPVGDIILLKVHWPYILSKERERDLQSNYLNYEI